MINHFFKDKNIQNDKIFLGIETESPKIEPRILPKNQLPKSPFSNFSDDRKNSLMDVYWNEIVTHGIHLAMESEMPYRIAKIKTTKAIKSYPITYSSGKQGWLYSEKFLDEFPDLVRIPWKKKMAEGWHLCILNKFPLLLKDYNFVIKE